MSERYFKKHGPRTDLGESFYPLRLTTHEPALLNSMTALTAAFVAGSVMREVAKRGGSKIGSAPFQEMLNHVGQALPEDVRNHCKAEVEGVLEWLEYPPEGEEIEIPELRVMREADVEAKLTLAQQAIESEQDLELQYYDTETERWPQRRVTPVAVDADEARLKVDNGTMEFWIDAEDIRWVMPVRRFARPATKPPADVLEFPFGTSANDD